jgi:polyisoprenoid-binding protein YceI
MIAKVRGRFGNVVGKVELDEDRPERSKVEATIDVKSIDTRDTTRDAHLRSPDFFDVDRHDAMHFVSTRVERAGKDGYRVTGDLTIRDVTRPITLDVTEQGRAADPWGGQRIGISATGQIKREDFGLTWNQALEAGGVLVGSDVKISIEAELVKQD